MIANVGACLMDGWSFVSILGHASHSHCNPVSPVVLVSLFFDFF